MLDRRTEISVVFPKSAPRILADGQASVVVIGGGVAGMWVAYQLVKAGIDTTVVSYELDDRGGLQGASRRSVGAFNTAPLSADDLDGYLQRIGQGQTHPSVARILSEYLPRALAELQELVELKPIKIGVALPSGGEDFLAGMKRHFRALGGKILNAWVTRLVLGRDGCRGIQYETEEGIGKLRCHAVIIASGGYAGLFANSIRTNCFGSMLGLHLKCGGIATNLEFLFKHGYGNIDTQALTPTEELPGAEIYDLGHSRIRWLEERLFDRQGTNTHLQAVQLWLRDPQTQFYIDLSYRGLYLKLSALNALLITGQNGSGGARDRENAALDEIGALFSDASRGAALQILLEHVNQRRPINYQTFEALKALLTAPDGVKFRVKPLTYFSMGGIGHVDFATNLRSVYVTGEAMHDFGANRVGGLPWSLYLAGAYRIVEQLTDELMSVRLMADDFEIIPKRSRFDPLLLSEIQIHLHEAQECELTTHRANQCVEWLRRKRRELEAGDGAFDDGISWLLVAEAVMQSSLSRTESRGFFFRPDFQEQNQALDHSYSCAWYDEKLDEVNAGLWTWPEIAARFRVQAAGTKEEEIVCDDRR
jgi:succinate dehydrogenase/fumarate reductase flavoprotein subunit